MAIPDSYYDLQEKCVVSTAWDQNYAIHAGHGFTAWVEYSDSLLAAARKVLLMLDVQGKLAHLMYEKEHLFENITRSSRELRALTYRSFLTSNLKRKRSSNTADPPSRCPMSTPSYALCAPCAMPYALCPMPHALCFEPLNSNSSFFLTGIQCSCIVALKSTCYSIPGQQSSLFVAGEHLSIA